MQQTASQIFNTLSRELRHLADASTALQSQFLPRAYDPLEIEALQSLDAINQSLACLAIYAAHLGTAASCSCPVRIDAALDQVSLAALADRLRGAHRPAPAPSEVELF